MSETYQQPAILALGRQATEFYRSYLQQCLGNRSAAQQNNLPRLIKADFEALNPYLPDNYAELLPRLEKLLEEIDLQDCKALLIPNITLHTILEQADMSAELQALIINPITCTLDYLQQHNLSEITLAATRHTMLGTQLSDFFSSRGIRIKIPAAEDVRLIDTIRLNVYANGANAALAKQLQQVLANYQHVLLACTELSILNHEESFMDMARLQIQAAASG